ncbi:MAG TPA: CHAT domain-containing protein [Thermomonospora sp.]|nr:CHAT domain-containing protein [Thermomonospora sp.]
MTAPGDSEEEAEPLGRLVGEIFTGGDGRALAELVRLVGDAERVARELAELADGEADVYFLAAAWEGHYRLTGRADSLGRAVDGYEQCAALISPDHREFPRVMTAIGLTLRLRFELTGARADAERAVEVLKAAYEAPVQDPSVRAHRANNLATAFQDRFELTDQGDDLDQAIGFLRSAVRDAPGDGLFRGNLGNSLRVRYQRTRDRADLDQAIAALEEAVRLDPDGGTPRQLNNLGIAMDLRAEATSQGADRDRAIELFEEAVARAPDQSLDEVMFSLNLGRSLWSRHGRTGSRPDLEAAATAYRRVVEADVLPYGRVSLDALWAYAFILLEMLPPPYDDRGAVPDGGLAARAVRAFDAALAAFPADAPERDRLLRGRRAAMGRLGRPAASEPVRLGGRSAFVLTGEHRGRIRRVVSLFPERQALLLGVGEDPNSARFADVMSFIDRAYPDGDAFSTWLVLRLPTPDDQPSTDLVLRYHADDAADEEWLALDALRATAEQPASHGPFSLPGGTLRAQVVTGHFDGTDRHLVLIGDEADEWLEVCEPDPDEARVRFFTVLSAAVAARPTARVFVLQGGMIQFSGDVPEPMPPQEMAEHLLEQAGPVGGSDGGPFDPAGYDRIGRDAMTWHLAGVRALEAYEAYQDPALLSKVVAMFRAAAEVLPDAHPHRPVHLRNLAVVLDRAFEAGGDLAALEEAVRVWREVAGTPDAPDEDWRNRWRLGAGLRALGELTARPGTLAEAITELRRVAQAVEPGTAEEATVLDALSSTLRAHAWHTEDAGSAAEAVAVGRRAVAVPADHPDRLGHLGHLAAALRIVAGLSGNAEPLDEAIGILRRIVADTRPGDPNAATRLHNLGTALWDQSSLRGIPSVFEEALALLRRSVEEQDDDDPNRAAHLSALAAALTQRYDETGDRHLLDEALTFQRAAVAATPPAVAVLPGRLLTLSTLLDRRYRRSGSRAVLEENVAVARRLAAEFPDLAEGHRLLGRLLCLRYERRGDLGDLADAVDTLRTAAERPAPPQTLALTLSDLGNALINRYATSGDLAALREAARQARRAVALLSGDSPYLPALLSNLANACRLLFERTGEPDLLHEAVDAGRRAVAGEPADIMDRVGSLTNLGLALRLWSRETGDAAARAEAVELLRRAVDLTPPDYHDRGLYLANYGAALSDDGADEDAVAASRHAVETTPYGAARAERLTNLLAHLIERHRRLGDPGTRDEVIATARSIVETATAAPVLRVRAAGVWGAHVAENGDWAEAARAFALGVDLLPAVAPRDLSRSDQEYGLTGLGPLAADGAACALRAGDLDRALLLLEQGRGVLLAQALDDRGDVSALRGRSADLADRFERLRDRLGDRLGPGGAGTEETRVRLAREWKDLLEEIRSAPGWADFLGSPSLSSLLEQARPGPIAVVNVSRYGSDALLVTPDDVRAVPLPELTPAALVARIETFWERQRSLGDLSEVLGWLWDAVTGPVLEALGLSGPPRGRRWPRVWWSAAGPLALLPLHAAGHHGEDGARSVLDRVVSSYTPTIRALRHARGRPVSGRPDSRDLVVVSVPDAPGADPLPGVRAETEDLVRRFPDATVLGGPEATRDRVLAALGSHRVAHFACHAAADPGQPSQGHLVLWDHAERPLTVLELGRHDLGRAQLAYLSACETAGGVPTLVDEALHITAACQLAGFPHVIGTLWPVSDRFAARVADEVYEELSRRGRVDVARAPLALHQVIRRARERHPRRAGLWGAFLHYGP